MIRTLEFPGAQEVQAGLGDAVGRAAYLDGLSAIEDRLRPDTRSPSTEPISPSILRYSEATPHLGQHLRQCSERVDAVRVDRDTEPVSTAVETFYLQISMRDRLIDLFQFATQQLWGRVSLSDYSADMMTRAAFDRDVSRMSAAGFPQEAIERTLGTGFPGPLDMFYLPDVIASVPDIPYPLDDRRVYVHTNSRGITYFLNTITGSPQGNNPVRIYYFSRVPNPRAATTLPPSRAVIEDPRNGSLAVVKKNSEPR